MKNARSKIAGLIGATLIDGCGNVVDDSVVLISDGRIVNVGSRNNITSPHGNIDLYNVAGKTVMPGLIDTHTHIAYAESELDNFTTTVPTRTLKAASNARKTLEAGFTTIRDLGAENLVDVGVRDAINEGVMLGPRMLVSGYKVASTGVEFPLYSPEVVILGRQTMNTPDEVRKAVRTLLARGVDVIKIMASGRTFRESSSPDAYSLTLEEARVAVSEAHNQNVRVAAHAHGSQGVKVALQAGCDTLEHGSVLDDDDIKFMADNGVCLIPTFTYSKKIQELKASCYLPEFSIRKAIESRKRRVESFNKALQGGVRVAMGSDAGVPFVEHGSNACEIEQLVQLGMTPMQALVASTRTAAMALGLGNKIGTLEKNKVADIIVVEDNPLKDVTCLQNKSKILAVFKDGDLVVNRD